ncbi:MAG: cytochrome P450 [Pseudomonadota bacterium]
MSNDTASHLLEGPKSIPLEKIDLSNWDIWEQNTAAPYLKRLREEAPLHYTAQSQYGPYWSVTRYADIKSVDVDHRNFSSAEGVTLDERSKNLNVVSFISSDPPRHDEQRKTVSPVVAPANLAKMADVIRARARRIFDELPIGEPFDWVDRVSIELTGQMLAILLGFPIEERRKLTYWSDVATGGPETGVVASEEARRDALMDCLSVFTDLWHERARAELGHDMISMLAHGDKTRDMVENPQEYLGTLTLLIIGGNDTTRNSLTGGVWALNLFPDQYAKIKADHSLLDNMVAEIIRWQTPLSYMRRTATQDVKMHDQTIRKGDKVVMWYASGNRDETVFANAEDLDVARKNARQHLAFGFGIHRCMGNRLAELQLRIVWRELLERYSHVEVVEEPTRLRSNFVRGYTKMPVVLHV